MNRDKYNNVGNNSGRDIVCRKCNEPYEDGYILQDFSDSEWKKFVILGAHLDDDYNEDVNSHTCIRSLKGCPSCS